MARYVVDPNDPTMIIALPDEQDRALLELYAKLRQLDPTWRPEHETKLPRAAAGRQSGGPQ